MTAFLETVVILMAVALVVEIAALVGTALVMKRSIDRASAVAEQVSQKVGPMVRMVGELRETVQPLAETIGRDSKEIAALVTARSQAIQAAYLDTSRRAERVRLRLTEGVGTVDGQPARRGIYRQVAEPVQTAGHVVRGLKFALWLFRKVA